MYKQEIAVRLLKELPAESEPTFADLTGGFGVDFSYMSKPFKKALYMWNGTSSFGSIATQNFKCLGLNNISTKKRRFHRSFTSVRQCFRSFLRPCTPQQQWRQVFRWLIVNLTYWNCAMKWWERAISWC
ncbi:hypothetical protein [Prevotella intermedia]|uniref:hypothetical protein n=1 Tax=Prevotella intermedia TaxID=28131 RepID=UPI0027B88C52|nr:hypothetical protein [Prevotella intermedia]